MESFDLRESAIFKLNSLNSLVCRLSTKTSRNLHSAVKSFEYLLQKANNNNVIKRKTSSHLLTIQQKVFGDKEMIEWDANIERHFLTNRRCSIGISTIHFFFLLPSLSSTLIHSSNHHHPLCLNVVDFEMYFGLLWANVAIDEIDCYQTAVFIVPAV